MSHCGPPLTKKDATRLQDAECSSRRRPSEPSGRKSGLELPTGTLHDRPAAFSNSRPGGRRKPNVSGCDVDDERYGG